MITILSPNPKVTLKRSEGILQEAMVPTFKALNKSNLHKIIKLHFVFKLRVFTTECHNRIERTG